MRRSCDQNGRRGAFKIVTDNPTGNRPFGGPSHRWEDNIRLNLKEIGINTRNWVDSAQEKMIGDPL